MAGFPPAATCRNHEGLPLGRSGIPRLLRLETQSPCETQLPPAFAVAYNGRGPGFHRSGCRPTKKPRIIFPAKPAPAQAGGRDPAAFAKAQSPIPIRKSSLWRGREEKGPFVFGKQISLDTGTTIGYKISGFVLWHKSIILRTRRGESHGYQGESGRSRKYEVKARG